MLENESFDEVVITQAIEIAKDFRGKDGLGVNLLQRKFKKGYVWATRLMEVLESRGIVGPHRESGTLGVDWKSLGHEVLI